MARVTCAISGLRFTVSGLENSNIPVQAGYFHPVFALDHKQLYRLYSMYSKGELNATDSYLLFCAFLNYTKHISWQHPVALNPIDSATKSMIANNIGQLVSVIERTSIIKHPSFKQPRFIVSYDTQYIFQIPNWIDAWDDNIDKFQQGLATRRQQQSLQEIENRLSQLIVSGESTERFAHIVANWADQAAIFPPHKAEEYKKVIRSCFNSRKMFNTSLELIKEIKDYCECNIEAGSIHFSTLSSVLREGINRHTNYLGGGSLALGYTLLTEGTKTQAEKLREERNKAEIENIALNAPDSPPKKEDYPDSLSYIKARLAYRVASNLDSSTKKDSNHD